MVMAAAKVSPANGPAVVSVSSTNEEGELAPIMSAPSVDSSSAVEEDTPDNTTDESPPSLSFPPGLTAQPVVPYRKSLAYSPTTPLIVKLVLPLLFVGTHYLFYYGQTADMWKLHATAHADVWANATSMEARQTYKAFGIDEHFHYSIDRDEDVEVFTYAYAIKQLWRAKKMPGKVLPRSAAVLLIIFSGVWPHLKLLLLAVTWFVPFGDRLVGRTPRHQRSLDQRTSILHWLSTLGKWSLADVLTVCVMVGVLHLDWDIDPDAIKHGVINNLPSLLTLTSSLYSVEDICDMVLKMDCSKQRNVINIAECRVCKTTGNKIFDDPHFTQKTARNIGRGIDTSGGGSATLRVVGMSGIYAFGGAVILSVLLSLIVDVLDHRARNRMAVASAATERQRLLSSGHEESLEEPLLNGSVPLELDSGESIAESREISVINEPNEIEVDTDIPVFSWCYMIGSVLSALMVILGADLASMERVVLGAGPELLRDILGVRWERQYSLRTLQETTGAAGGLDYALLMPTFSLFCVFGPILRASLCVFVGIMGRLPSQQLRRMVVPMTTVIHFIGSFCAWEVFAIAIVMVDMLMPSITNTIIQKPICGQLSEDGSCLQVEFNVLKVPFSMIFMGGFALVAISHVAVARGRAIVAAKRERRRLMNSIAGNVVDDEELIFETHQV